MTNRRGFIRNAGAMAAAAFMRPTVLLRPEFDLEAALQRFVDAARDRCLRYDLSEPWTVGPWTYATDARWMIRGEIGSVPDDGIDKRRPDAAKIFAADFARDDFARRSRPLELPPMEQWILGDTVCPVCHDRRIKLAVDYTVNHDRQYRDFDIDTFTAIDRNCDWCHDGRRPREAWPCLVEIDGHTFEGARLQTVATLPGVRVIARDWGKPEIGGNVGILQFAGHGFEGLLAGCRNYGGAQ